MKSRLEDLARRLDTALEEDNPVGVINRPGGLLDQIRNEIVRIETILGPGRPGHLQLLNLRVVAETFINGEPYGTLEVPVGRGREGPEEPELEGPGSTSEPGE
jgi:hypothetical protein